MSQQEFTAIFEDIYRLFDSSKRSMDRATNRALSYGLAAPEKGVTKDHKMNYAEDFLESLRAEGFFEVSDQTGRRGEYRKSEKFLKLNSLLYTVCHFLYNDPPKTTEQVEEDSIMFLLEIMSDYRKGKKWDFNPGKFLEMHPQAAELYKEKLKEFSSREKRFIGSSL